MKKLILISLILSAAFTASAQEIKERYRLDTVLNVVTMTMHDGSKYNVYRDYGKSYIKIMYKGEIQERRIMRREDISKPPVQWKKVDTANVGKVDSNTVNTLTLKN